MRRRRRWQPRGHRLPWLRVLLVVCVLVSAVGAVSIGPSTAFTSATLARGSAAPVTGDATGLLGLDVSPSVSAGTESRLVTVTNRFSKSVTAVVTLDGGSGTLSNARGLLAPGASMVTTVTLGCGTPPDSVTFSVATTAKTELRAAAKRSTTVDASGCTRASASFASISVVDQSDQRPPRKARYTVQYVVDARETTFERVTVEFDNRDRNEVEMRSSTAPNDVVQFASGGNRKGETYVITIRLFDADGEVGTARIEVTDSADGDGTVYAAP